MKQSERNKVADCSTGQSNGRYYLSIGEACENIETTLESLGYTLDWHGKDFSGRNGRIYLQIKDSDKMELKPDRWIVFVWYTMPSGRLEITTYVC